MLKPSAFHAEVIGSMFTINSQNMSLRIVLNSLNIFVDDTILQPSRDYNVSVEQIQCWDLKTIHNNSPDHVDQAPLPSRIIN